MGFRSLHFAGWRQFDHIAIDFHPNLTILTGGNGSGKTAILRLLARHLGWWFDELNVPSPKSQLGALKYLSTFLRNSELLQLIESPETSSLDAEFIMELINGLDSENILMDRGEGSWFREQCRAIGSITYDNSEANGVLYIEKQPTSATYAVHVTNQSQQTVGLFIPSHRAEFVYRQVENIPLASRSADELSNRMSESLRSRALYQFNQHTLPPSYFMKETLLSWAILGYGNRVVRRDSIKMRYFESFQAVMRSVLPPKLGFTRLDIRPPEVVLVTETGEFMLDAVSGGIGATLDLAWQIFIRDPERLSSFAVVIDEVENHLHASMQRTILPGLCEAFPRVQFVVSTHSPLVVGSVKDSTVYALRYNERRRVRSERLDLDTRAGTAAGILREVLEVPVTAPVWVENMLTELAVKYSVLDASSETIRNLRSELQEAGLSEFAPQTIANLIEKWDMQE